VETEVVDKKRSSSRPEMGSFRSNVRVYNQDGLVVMTMKSIGLIRVRETEASE
jgi:acyl dehydratase